MSSTSELAQKIAREIVGAIETGELTENAHLSAQKLADRFGVSRSPVREALHLALKEGFVVQKANRGFFVRAEAPHRPDGDGASELPFDPPSPYQQIASDWLADRLPSDVTEQMLRSRYDLTRAQLTDILLRATREGWAERKPGYGWLLLPVAKTPEAFEQIYRFRMLIEPAAMLEPTFKADRTVLERHRTIQQRMLDVDVERLSGEKLLDNGAQFHEAIIRFSGNPFFHQALVRVNRMRRLLEYRSRVDRRRLYTQCSQHLEIIDMLESGDVVEASYLMRRHLSGALVQKSPLANAPAQNSAPADAD